MSEKKDEKKYERGVFTPSTDYNSAITNKTAASEALTALGDAKWTYGTDANGNPILGDNILNGYLSDYQNRDKFTYDLNSDALYKQYKDQYMHQGKIAAEDVMGQAAAMTGGYGNSYAATVGNQAYQSYLGKLNDVIPELYQLAYNKYNQEGQDLLSKIGLLQGERDNYYARYNEDYNRAFNELDYWSNMANNLYNRDYTAYTSDETYKYNTYRDSIEDKQWQDNFDFAKQQYEDSKYVNAGGQYKVEKDESGKAVVNPDIDKTLQYQKQADISSNVIGYDGTANTSWFDDNLNFKKAVVVETKDGKTTFEIDGKTVTYNTGVNPYTKTVNPDTKKGTFSNGYQPNNVGGKKLTKTGEQDYMNGVLQSIWKTEDGTKYIWNGLKNQYSLYKD